MLVVQKFGGTSLADAQCCLRAARKVAAQRELGHDVIVVVSARGHTTDRLVTDADQVAKHCSAREMDVCLAAGEQISAALMAMALESMGHKAVSLTGWQAGLLTDDVYGNAAVLALRNNRIMEELDAGKIVVVAGFQGISLDGDITTLGRGGSDTTAVALAAFLKADLCQIYTDVDGVYDRDPRKFPDAVKYSRIGYDDMLTLVRQGAQVLHDRCVEWGKRYRVPIQVLSSFRPGEGTMVMDPEDTVLPKER